jgi:serine/threonine protein kinase
MARGASGLVQAWKRGEEPRLADYLPTGPTALRQVALLELVKVDLACRHEAGRPRALASYVAEYPAIAPGGVIPADLIVEAFLVARRHDETTDPEAYVAGFPGRESELRRMLALGGGRPTTAAWQAPSGARPAPGTALDDFDLIAELGAGSFATVYLARQRSMQRRVALKVSETHTDEPQTLAQLEHENIVRVHDQRVLADRGLHLLYMQYCAGGTLEQALKRLDGVPPAERTGRLLVEAVDEHLRAAGEAPADGPERQRFLSATWPETVALLGAAMARALSHAHAQGVLHRDVKTANVLLTAGCRPQLADFNVSYGRGVEGSSPAAFFGGSLLYMSPEQLEASDPRRPGAPEDLDARSDVYALGVVLWEMLAGELPHPEPPYPGDLGALLDRLIEDRRKPPPDALPAGAGRAPPALLAALRRALEPRRDDRFASAEQLARHLELALSPRAEALIAAEPRGWRTFAQRWPTWALLLALGLPNLVLGVINALYNLHVETTPITEALYGWQVAGVNAVVYALGIFAMVRASRPIVRAARARAAGGPRDAALAAAARRRCLSIGGVAAATSLALWAVSATLFWSWTAAVLSGEDLGARYAHYVVSQLLCGLIAAALAFFTVTFVAVRAYYARFVDLDRPDPDAPAALGRLERRLWVGLGVVVFVPFLAVVLLALSGTWVAGAFLALGALGALCLAVVWLLVEIRKDLDALARL